MTALTFQTFFSHFPDDDVTVPGEVTFMRLMMLCEHVLWEPYLYAIDQATTPSLGEGGIGRIYEIATSGVSGIFNGHEDEMAIYVGLDQTAIGVDDDTGWMFFEKTEGLGPLYRQGTGTWVLWHTGAWRTITEV